MMKAYHYLSNIVLYISLILVTLSCNTNTSFKVGMLIPNTHNERFPKDRDYLTAEVKKLGGEVIAMDCEDDDKLQIKQAIELIEQGVNVLAVIAHNKNTAAVIVREAHKKGVKVIAYDRIIANCDLDFYVSFDNVKVGELMAQGALKAKPRGNYILLGGDKSDQNAIWVRQGMLNLIEPKVKEGSIKIVYDIYCEDWAGENAYHEIRTFLYLSNSVPDAIVSAYDGLSTGAIKALDDNKVPIANFPAISGQNAELEACQNIVNGKQTMTVYKPLIKLATEVAALAAKLAKGETIDKNKMRTINNGAIDVPSILIEPTYVDANNMRATIIADDFWKESDVYKNE